MTSNFTPGELAALRRRFKRQREGLVAIAQPDKVTVEDLERIREQGWQDEQAEQRRMHSYYLDQAAEAELNGMTAAAKTLRGLAAGVAGQAERLRLEMVSSHLALNQRRRAEGARVRAKAAAAQPRPARRLPIRDLITDMMKAQRASGVKFHSFMQRWRSEPLEGLRLAKLPDSSRYTITDENGDLGEAPYMRSTLERMYSESR